MHQRAVAGKPAKLRLRIEDAYGVAATPDGALTVSVKDVDGATVSTGAAVARGVSEPGEFVYTFTPATLGVFRADMSFAVAGDPYTESQELRVVDRRPLPLSVLRRDSELASADLWDFLDAVDGAEDALECALKFRVVTTQDRITIQTQRDRRVLTPSGPHMMQELVAGTWQYALQTPQTLDVSLVRIKDDGLEKPTGASWGFLTGGAATGVWFPGTYVLDIKHGLTQTPADVQRAIRLLARHFLESGPNSYPDRASKIMSAETEIWFSRGGSYDSWFGIPEVDAVVSALRLDMPIAENDQF